MAKTCPKCSGTMTEGYLLDQGHGTWATVKWVEGLPEKSIWVGLKLRGRKKLAVVTWRCGRCGLLESYATGE